MPPPLFIHSTEVFEGWASKRFQKGSHRPRGLASQRHMMSPVHPEEAGGLPGPMGQPGVQARTRLLQLSPYQPTNENRSQSMTHELFSEHRLHVMKTAIWSPLVTCGYFN